MAKNNIQTKFNVGDKIWIAYHYEDYWYMWNKEGCFIDSIKIYVGEDRQIEFYTIKTDIGYQEFSSRFCFSSFEECFSWCQEENDKQN